MLLQRSSTMLATGRWAAVRSRLVSSRLYSFLVLLILMLVYFLNQLDRFVLGIAARSISRDLNFGRMGCFYNITALSEPQYTNVSCKGACINTKNESECYASAEVPCVWEYTATGIEYEFLAGPAFTLVFTMAAVPLGVLAGHPTVNRKIGLAICLVLWSTMTLLAGFTSAFWQLLLTRLGLGIFEAVCTPFATSIISDYFKENKRATALGFYNWGIYVGYSTAFAFNFILVSIGWRWAFRIASFPGFIVALILFIVVKEPTRIKPIEGLRKIRRQPLLYRVLVTYLQAPLLLLCVAGGLRQGGGLVWSYNVKAYFTHYYCGSVNVGSYLSWVPLIGGTVGALFGGWVSDRVARTRGIAARLWVLIISQLAAIPFLVGVLYLPPSPWAFLSLLPAYAIGEMWIGVCLAIVIAMAPRDIVSAAVALFLLVINNLGGSMPLLVPVLEMALSLRIALLLLFPGLYLLAALLFTVTLCVWKAREVWRKRTLEIETEPDGNDGSYDEDGEVEPLLHTQQRREGLASILTHSQEVSIINS